MGGWSSGRQAMGSGGAALRRWTGRLRSVAPLGMAAALLVPQAAWAQADAEVKQARWVTAYALVGLCIGLSLYSVCRPSARRKASS